MLNKIVNIEKLLIIAILSIFSLIFLPLPSVVNAAYYGAPTVMTGGTRNVTTSSATLTGSVDGNNYSVNSYFEYGKNTDLGFYTLKGSYGSDYNNFNIDISGLTPDTTYYFRAIGHNLAGTSYGKISSFRTKSNYIQTNSLAPTATTKSATQISNNRAEINSLILNPAGDATNTWFEWGATPNLGNKTVTTSIGMLGAIRYVNTLSGLNPGTIYYFRSVAENSHLRNIGPILSFVTSGNTIIQNTTIKEPVITSSSSATINTNNENSTETSSVASSSLSANVLGSGSFLPISILGWLILIDLILILVLIIRHPHIRYWNNEIDKDHS